MHIQRAIGSEIHPCKCLVGIYETYGGDIVRIVDAVGGERCGHELGQQLQPTGNDEIPSGPALARRSRP